MLVNIKLKHLGNHVFKVVGPFSMLPGTTFITNNFILHHYLESLVRENKLKDETMVANFTLFGGLKTINKLPIYVAEPRPDLPTKQNEYVQPK